MGCPHVILVEKETLFEVRYSDAVGSISGNSGSHSGTGRLLSRGSNWRNGHPLYPRGKHQESLRCHDLVSRVAVAIKEIGHVFGLAWLSTTAIYLLLGVACGMALLITGMFIKAKFASSKDTWNVK